MKLLNHIFILIGILSLSYLLSCSHHPYAGVMDKAEALMEEHPDSAFALLNTVNKDSLGTETDKARYALLMSMALDKNYIDTTEFDVLQPAIDYYLTYGNPDERLKTYYYQGCIFKNKGSREKALNSFLNALDIASKSHDSLTVARTLVAQALTYLDLYDFKNYTADNIRAAEIYKALGKDTLEFDCLSGALSGSLMMEDQTLADSLIHTITSRYPDLADVDYKRLQVDKLRYAIMFQGKNEVQALIDSLGDNLLHDTFTLIDLARAYRKLEKPDKSAEILDYVNKSNKPYDTLKFLAVSAFTFEEKQDYANALSAYKQFSSKTALINRAKFNQKVQSLDEKNRIELDAQKDAERRTRIIWGCAAIIIILMMGIGMGMLSLNKAKIKNRLSRQRARNAELENEKLKIEKELTQQKANATKLENDKLKSEAQLVQQKARAIKLENDKLKSESEKLTLEKKTLELERDNKALEAENLQNRIDRLENESESLKELLSAQRELPDEVKKILKTRMEMLNALIAGYITENDKYGKPYESWVKELTENVESFMNSNRLAFQASHPRFIKYFEDLRLTPSEINYICLYALGLRGKDVGNYMKKRGHVNISSAIRKKLGIDKHETNIGIYVRKLLKEL